LPAAGFAGVDLLDGACVEGSAAKTASGAANSAVLSSAVMTIGRTRATVFRVDWVMELPRWCRTSRA